MEKRVVLAVVLTIGVYVAYIGWFAPRPAPRPAVPHGTGPVAASTGAARTDGPAPDGPRPAPGAPAAPGARAPSKQYEPSADEKLVAGPLELTVASKGAALKDADAYACVYHARGDAPVEGDPGRATAVPSDMPGALSADLESPIAALPDLTASDWKLARRDGEVSAEIESGGVLVTRTLRMSGDPALPWHADVRYTLRNVSAEAGSLRTFEIVGPVLPATKMPDDGVLVATSGEDAKVEVLHAVAIHQLLTENPKSERPAGAGKWAFIGARADFYLGALVPKGDLPADTTVGFRRGTLPGLPGDHGKTAAAAFRIPVTVPPAGGEVAYEFMLYAGPNQRSLLQDDQSPYYVLHGATVQRTFIFSLGWLSRFLAWLLKGIASTGIGYGLAVLCLTILVRGALFPLSRKSQISMRLHGQKMARLKPKMDALKEKHKDPKKQQEMTMKLMREEKVSLLPGGCLLAFAQMPVWIALYGVLQTTFEMRHAQFLWAHDLTAPDHLIRLATLEGDGFFARSFDHGWLNLLPLLMMVVWYTSAAMQPLPADPQQAQQAKMMRWMPVLFGFFLYTTASGLTLYMTMSALWSIGETWLIRKLWLSKLENALK
jgi:YidC/Oxa1 family membrane protein insertase